MITFTTAVNKYYFNLNVEGRTLDPLIIYGQFAQNVINWILSTGFWDDNGVWDDAANWID